MIWLYVFVALASLWFLRSYLPTKFMDPQSAVLMLHITCAITSSAYFIGVEFLGIPVTLLAFLSCLMSSVVTIVSNHGVPQISNYSQWLSTVAQGADFPFFMISMIFLSKSLGLADAVGLLIILRRSVWFICIHASKNYSTTNVWKSIEPFWVSAKSIEEKVLLMSATCEIMIGFWLFILILTPQRQLLSLFVYWNFLRMRFVAPRSHAVHQRAWEVIGENINPVLSKMGPVQGLVGRAKPWFTNSQ